MGVVHGRNDLQVMQCVQAYAETGLVHTIGIPRILISMFKDKNVRLRLAQAIHRGWPAMSIHLLGTNSDALTEVPIAAVSAPYIRSVDTSLPFNYAIAGERLHPKATPGIKRPENYFRTDFGVPMHFKYMRDNVATMIAWARGLD
jgi:hypothetical protein